MATPSKGEDQYNRCLIRKDSNWLIKKPLPKQDYEDVGSLEELAPLSLTTSPSASYESFTRLIKTTASTNHVPHSLERHMSLIDLIAVGIGVTIGSGLFVLCGLISHEYAGPAGCLAWMVSGLAACLSGACYAELSARIPLTGSAYAYSFVALGEYPAMLAAACLALDYIAAAAAVSRSWGDKLGAYLCTEYGEVVQEEEQYWIVSFFLGGDGIVNPFAFMVSSVCVLLLLNGVKESKSATHFFTSIKVTLVAFMIGMGIFYVQPSNWIPFAPFGASGVLRGATGTFFGYLGFDEIALLGGEAKNPKKNLPRAILGTISCITAIYVIAALILAGMVPYENISPVSGFPAAFAAHNANFVAQITAMGEIVTLPVVILLTIMCQPRLQYALAKDGLLPSVFGEINSRGNLSKGIIMAGVLVVAISTLVPFDHLNDMVSCAVLTALSLTDTSLIILWHPSPISQPLLAESIMGAFHILALTTGVLVTHFANHTLGKLVAMSCACSLVACVLAIVYLCPRSSVFGSRAHSSADISSPADDGYFRTPLVPWVPCMAIFINWYLISQLELFGIALHLVFLAATTLYYFCYAINHSVGNNMGWQHSPLA